MRTKTDELLENVPEIVIKTREKYNEEMKKKTEEEKMKRAAADAAAITAQVKQEIAAEERGNYLWTVIKIITLPLNNIFKLI